MAAEYYHPWLVTVDDGLQVLYTDFQWNRLWVCQVLLRRHFKDLAQFGVQCDADALFEASVRCEIGTFLGVLGHRVATTFEPLFLEP